MKARGRRWREPEPPPPLDVRLVPAAGALWAGCLVGLRAGSVSWWVAIAAALALLVLGLVLAARWMMRARKGSALPAAKHQSRRYLAGTAAALAFFGCGALLAAVQVDRAQSDPLAVAAGQGDWAVVRLMVTAPPRPMPGVFGSFAQDESVRTDAGRWLVPGQSDGVVLDGVSQDTDVSVTVFAAGDGWARLDRGQTITVSGALARDTFGTLPGVTLRTPGQPTAIRDPPWWQGWAVRMRGRLAESAAVLAPDRAGLLPGLVVGDTRGVDADLTADAKTTGLTHLVAVSGSHIAIICGAVVLLLRRFGPRFAAFAAAATLVALVVLVGPQPSVLRSAVMGGIALMAVLLGRARTALPALAGAVIVLLLLDPSLAAAAGFALSVQATAALVLLAPVWSLALRRRGVPAGWADLLVLPLAAQVATMPVIAAISGSVSLVAVPANVIVAPVVAPALIIGLLCALAGPLWPAVGRGLARVDGPLLGWISGTAHRFARWPGATVPWPASVGGVLALAALTAAVLLLLRHRTLRAIVAAAVCGALIVLVPGRLVQPGWPVAGWLITGCEVGQGDAMVLSTGEVGTAVVVDTGPDPSLMNACLDRLGVTTIPLLVLTHLHADHVGGLSGAIAGRSVGAIGVGPERDLVAPWTRTLAIAAAADIPVVSLPVGTHWSSGDLALSVLGPRKVYYGTESDPNNDSVVVMATVSGVRILMTGDIEEPAQQALLDSEADLSADVLKAPHHGSAKVLPKFLAAVSPRVAVIGVGQGNDYGQPSSAALTRLAGVGVSTVLRTDTEGDIAVCLTDRGLMTVSRGVTLGGKQRVPP